MRIALKAFSSHKCRFAFQLVVNFMACSADRKIIDWGILEMRLIVLAAVLSLSACGPSLDEQFEQTMTESIASADDEASKTGFRQMLEHKDQISDDEKRQFVEMWATIKDRREKLKGDVLGAKTSGEISTGDADNMIANLDTL